MAMALSCPAPIWMSVTGNVCCDLQAQARHRYSCCQFVTGGALAHLLPPRWQAEQVVITVWLTAGASLSAAGVCFV